MYDLIKNRRSIRKYSSVEVEREKVDKLIKAILFSPSGHNLKTVEIIYINDKDILSKLAVSKAAGAKFLEGSPQCLIILGDESKTDIWIEDSSIATTVGHLAAMDMGLGSCWIQVRKRKTANDQFTEEYIKNLLNIPENLRVEAILAFGYPDEEKAGYTEDDLLLHKVSKNSYGNGYFE